MSELHEKSKITTFHNLDIFKILSVFLFCAFIGWMYETLLALILENRFSARGYLFVLQPLQHYLPFLSGIPVIRNIPLVLGLPLIEMYGFGGTLMILGFRKLGHRPIVLFFTGMFFMTLFELLGSYFCTGVLHYMYWDYSKQPFNFEGRISLASALCWGTLSVLSVKVFAPMIDKIYQKEKDLKYFKVIIVCLTLGAVVCAVVKYYLFPGVLVNT